MQEVEGYIIKGKEGQEGVTGEGSLLKETQTVIPQKKSNSKCRVPPSVLPMWLSRDCVAASGITISAARYSSEDAAVLVEYVISIVEYTKRCGPLKQALETLDFLKQERDKIYLNEIEDQKVSEFLRSWPGPDQLSSNSEPRV